MTTARRVTADTQALTEPTTAAHCLAYGHAFDGLSCGCCGAVEYV